MPAVSGTEAMQRLDKRNLLPGDVAVGADSDASAGNGRPGVPSLPATGGGGGGIPNRRSPRSAEGRLTAIALAGFMLATVGAVAILAFAWKFGLEEWVDPLLPGIHDHESAAERWEFVIASTLLAALAMLLPGLAAYRQIDERMRSDRIAAAVFASAPQPMLVMDAGWRIQMANPAFVELTGINAAAATGASLSLLESGLQEQGLLGRIDGDLLDSGRWSGELWLRRADGSPYVVWLSLTSVRGDGGEPASVVGVLTDITWRKQREEAAIYLATHDALTGLANPPALH